MCESLILQQEAEAPLSRVDPRRHVLEVLERRVQRVDRLPIVDELSERPFAALDGGRAVIRGRGELPELGVQLVAGHQLAARLDLRASPREIAGHCASRVEEWMRRVHAADGNIGDEARFMIRASRRCSYDAVRRHTRARHSSRAYTSGRWPPHSGV